MAKRRAWYQNRVILAVIGVAVISMALVLGPILGAVLDAFGFVGSAVRGLATDPFGRLLLFNVVVGLGVLLYRRQNPESFASWFGGRTRSGTVDIARDFLRGDESKAQERLRSLGRVEEGTELQGFVRAIGRLLESSRTTVGEQLDSTRASMLRPFDISLSDDEVGQRVAQRGHPLALVPAAEWAKAIGKEDLAVAICHAGLARLSDDPEAVLRFARVIEREDPPREIQRSHLAEAVRQDLTRHWPMIG